MKSAIFRNVVMGNSYRTACLKESKELQLTILKSSNLLSLVVHGGKDEAHLLLNGGENNFMSSQNGYIHTVFK